MTAERLAVAPPYAADPAGYIGVEVDIRERFAPGRESLAIPTTHREVLLQQHSGGRDARRRHRRHRVRARGAGTMQEMFQDAAQNADRIFGRSPMAFLDAQHYCAQTGLYPTLERQAQRLGFANLLSVSDEPEQILERFPAITTPPRPDETPPEMIVRRMRNAR